MSTYCRTPVLPALPPAQIDAVGKPAYTRRWCTPQLVWQAALRKPRAAAVKSGSRTMTYAELDERSHHLAAHLSLMGVGPDVPVIVCVERSFDFVVAALAIMKAGGAFVPLDPAWSPGYRNRVAQQCGASIAVTRLAYGMNTPILVDLDRDWFWLSQSTTDVLPDRASRNGLACVLYTKEGVEEPIGVEITHANLLNLVFWHREAFSVSSSDRVAHISDPSSANALWEIWPYLTACASVVMAPDNVSSSPEKLRTWLEREGITASAVPPELAEPLVQSPWTGDARLRFLSTGAEVLRRGPRFGLPFRVVQIYGAAELAGVGAYLIVPPSRDKRTITPIGVPAANTRVYVLDENRQPVPAGSTGEIYVAGASVARGYRNQPERTAERFMQDPFSQTPGVRMCRTGDLGWLLPDGQIALAGKSEPEITA
jgi:amino acid adenylation domain-containing protein